MTSSSAHPPADVTSNGSQGTPPVDFEKLAEQNIIPPDNRPRLAKQWDIRTLEHAYEEREPLQFLIDGLLPMPSLSIVYGGPGSLKSALLADAAVCVAAGLKWLEALPVDEVEHGTTFGTLQAPVLWIDFDNGVRRTDERFSAFAKARDLDEKTPLHYVSMAMPWLDASNRPFVEQLSEVIRFLGAKLVIIDNLGLITGNVEENSAQMSTVMGNLRWLCEETESAIILIHHQRKGSGSDKARLGEMLRGHSSIEAALDLALMVERPANTDSVAVVPTKVRGFNSTNLFGAQFTYRHKGDSYDLDTARFFSEKIESKQEKERRLIERTVISELRALLSEHEIVNQSQIVTAVRDNLSLGAGDKVPGVNKVRGVINEMVRSGQIIAIAGERKTKCYFLSESEL